MVKSQASIDQAEYQIILDIGMIHTKIGTSLNNLPFKIISTPTEIFLNPKFLTNAYFNLYKKYSKKLEIKIEEFLYKLFYEELIETVDNHNIIISINLFVPNYILLCLEEILKKKFKVKNIIFIPAQFTPMYISKADSGIIIDFGFTNFSFIPFFKGHVLKRYIRTSKKSGIHLIKRLNESVVKINGSFKNLDFKVRLELLINMLTGFINIPSMKEKEVILENGMDTEKMRKKILKYVNSEMNLYINYLENFRVSEYLFEDSDNIVLQFLLFLINIPTDLRIYIVNNIIPVGGFCLINRFFYRFKDELNYFVRKNEYFAKHFTQDFVDNFNFVHNGYPSNLVSWAGAAIFLKLIKKDEKQQKDYLKNCKILFNFV